MNTRNDVRVSLSDSKTLIQYNPSILYYNFDLATNSQTDIDPTSWWKFIIGYAVHVTKKQLQVKIPDIRNRLQVEGKK